MTEKKCSTATSFTRLMDAVMSADHQTVKKLSQAGADVNAKNSKRWTALMLACRNCNGDSSMECVRELLKAGADVNLQSNKGWTALMMASRYCNGDSSMECVRELLKSGVDVNRQDDDGWTALMMACRYCNEDSSMECVRELLQAGADWTMLNNGGLTAKKLLPENQKENFKEIIDTVKRMQMKQEIMDEIREELWAYGGIGYELLQIKSKLLGMQ